MDADWQGLGVTLTQLVAPDRWQRVQDQLAEVLGIGLRTVAADKTLLVNPSWPSWLDVQKIASLFRLGEELDELLQLGAPPQETVTITRPIGISFSICPLRAGSSKVVAYWVVGPMILGKREDPEQFHQRMSSIGQDPALLWPFLLTIRLYSFGSMKSILRMLEDVGTTMLQSAGQGAIQGSSGAGGGAGQAELADRYLERMARTVLDLAVAATQADGGSVMLFDPSRTAMQIRASIGLGQDVVQRARVRLGEGIAGRVAAQRAALVLDERTEDEQVRRLMTRKELTSSLVMPIVSEPQDVPVGVLNLHLRHPQRRFSLEHVEQLRRVMDLAGLAAGSLQLAFGARRNG